MSSNNLFFTQKTIEIMKTFIVYLSFILLFSAPSKAQIVSLRLDAQGPVGLAKLTFDQIQAVTNPQEGMIAYDQNFKCLRVYNGSKWVCTNENNLLNTTQAYAFKISGNEVVGNAPLVHIALDGNKNVYIFGIFTNRIAFGTDTLNTANLTGRDFFLAKFLADGTYQWAKQFKTDSFVELSTTLTDLAVDNAGNVYVTAQFGGTMNINNTNVATASNSSGDILLAKFNTNGNLRWFKRYASSTAASASNGDAISLDGKGNLYFAGDFAPNITVEGNTLTTIGSALGDRDAFVSKMDTAGNFVWIKQINNTIIRSVKTDSSGSNVYVTGLFNKNITTLGGANNLTIIGGIDMLLVKLNATNGNVVWARKAGGTGTEIGKALAIEPNGNVYLMATYTSSFTLGVTTTVVSGSQDIFLTKYDPSGNVIWVNTIVPTTNISTNTMRGSGGLDFDKNGFLWLSDGCADITGLLMTSTGATHSLPVNGPFYAKIATDGTVLKLSAVASGTINSIFTFNVKSDGVGGAFIGGQYRSFPINIGVSSLPLSIWNHPIFGIVPGVDLFIARVN
jgi:hypothetical protein